MTQNSTIVQELVDLKSSLAGLAPENIYTVPEGYFDGLSTLVLNRVRAMEAFDASEELAYLSPVLSNISREMPYTIPEGYFEGLEEKLMKSVRDSNDYLTAQQEIETLSPLLAGLKKQVPYSVPQGYFESLASGKPLLRIVKAETKVISISRRKWFRFASAAVMTGVVALAVILYFATNNNKESGGLALAKFTLDLKKMNETQKDNLIEYIDGGLGSKQDVAVTTHDKSSTDVKELLKGVSDQELKDFQEQTESMEDVLMTN